MTNLSDKLREWYEPADDEAEGYILQAADELDRLTAEIEQLQSALRKLRNEASGAVGSPEFREIFGNTNTEYLELRIREADAILPTKSSHPYPSDELSDTCGPEPGKTA